MLLPQLLAAAESAAAALLQHRNVYVLTLRVRTDTFRGVTGYNVHIFSGEGSAACSCRAFAAADQQQAADSAAASFGGLIQNEQLQELRI